MTSRKNCLLLVLSLFIWSRPEFSIAQNAKDVSAYLCATYKDFQILPEYRPVKFVNKLYPADVSPKDASRIDSLYSVGDTIYFLGSDFRELFQNDPTGRSEAGEMINAINASTQRVGARTLECAGHNSSSTAKDLSISFSEPIFTKDMKKCLMKYEIKSSEQAGGNPYRSRETLMLKYEGGKWIDMQAMTLQIIEVRE